MMKQACGLGVAVLLGLWSAEAAAQTSFGQKGDFSFSIERAMGLYSGHLALTAPGPDIDVDSTAFELGIGAGLGPNGSVGHPTKTARIGVDGFIIDHLSLGGSLGFASYGDDLDSSMFLLAPRVGYFAGISRHVGFWGRGGLTYYSVSSDPGPDSWQLMLTAEAMFTFAPNEGFAFLFGPVLDLGFAGRWEPVNDDYRFRDRVFGLAFGLVGFF